MHELVVVVDPGALAELVDRLHGHRMEMEGVDQQPVTSSSGPGSWTSRSSQKNCAAARAWSMACWVASMAVAVLGEGPLHGAILNAVPSQAVDGPGFVPTPLGRGPWFCSRPRALSGLPLPIVRPSEVLSPSGVLQAGPIPSRQVGRTFIGALEKGHQHGVRVLRQSDGLVGKYELAQALVVVGSPGLIGHASKPSGSG